MKNKTLGLLLIAIIANPVQLMANGDSQYPAANFQPTVIFIDASVAATGATNYSAYDPNFPAASFQPKVIFIDASASRFKADTATFDPAFPAANFVPKVIYP